MLLLVTAVTTGATTGAATPITSVTVPLPEFATHKLPAASTEMLLGVLKFPAEAIGGLTSAAPALVSAEIVPAPFAIHTTPLPSMARAVAPLMLAPE